MQTVSVNIPSEFILQPDARDLLTNAQNLWGSDNATLILEIIERSLVSEVDTAIKVLTQLRAQGIAISIDDFGTGYSSLSYFEKLPVNELKIDQSFVFNLLKSKSSRSIVKLIINLAHAFELKVVAEGVEDIETLRYLKKIGCDIIQGFYFARPMPQKEYRKWLREFSMGKI